MKFWSVLAELWKFYHKYLDTLLLGFARIYLVIILILNKKEYLIIRIWFIPPKILKRYQKPKKVCIYKILLYYIYVICKHFGKISISLIKLIITLCQTDISNFSQKIAHQRPVENWLSHEGTWSWGYKNLSCQR